MRISKNIIRPVEMADISQLAFVIKKSFKDVAQRFNLTLENCPTHPSNCTAETVENDMKRGVSFFLKIDNGIPAGCIGLERADDGETCYLTRLGVLPGRRKRGFGTSLVEKGLSEAAEAGAKQVSVAIIAEDTSLKNWYAKLGFEEQHTRKFDHLPFQVTFMNRAI